MSLLDRERRRAAREPVVTPVERHVDVALHEAVFSMMESLVPDYSAHEVLRTRSGGRMQGIAPSNAYPCSDGTWVIIAGNADSIFRRFMVAIGRTDRAEDEGLASNSQRWHRRDELDDAIGAWTRELTRDEALARLDAAAVPAGPIYIASDIVADPQYLARDMVQELPVDVAGTQRQVTFPGIVPILGERSLAVSHVGPDLGEHTHHVLTTILGRECTCAGREPGP